MLKSIETQIVEALIAEILKDKTAEMRVYDGEEFACKWTRDTATLMEAHASTDEDRLSVQWNDGEYKRGAILLIYGNGADLISDYSVNCEHFVRPVYDMVDAFEAQAEERS